MSFYDLIYEPPSFESLKDGYNHINNVDKLHPSDQSEYERLMNNSESSYTTDADSSKDSKKRKKKKRRKSLHESQLRYLTPAQLRIENALVRRLREERKEKLRVARNLRNRERHRLYSINGQQDYNNCIMKATMECLKKKSRASVPEAQYDYRLLPYKRLNLTGAPKPNLKHYLNSEERKTELKYDFFPVQPSPTAFFKPTNNLLSYNVHSLQHSFKSIQRRMLFLFTARLLVSSSDPSADPILSKALRLLLRVSNAKAYSTVVNHVLKGAILNTVEVELMLDDLSDDLKPSAVPLENMIKKQRIIMQSNYQDRDEMIGNHKDDINDDTILLENTSNNSYAGSKKEDSNNLFVVDEVENRNSKIYGSDDFITSLGQQSQIGGNIENSLNEKLLATLPEGNTRDFIENEIARKREAKKKNKNSGSATTTMKKTPILHPFASLNIDLYCMLLSHLLLKLCDAKSSEEEEKWSARTMQYLRSSIDYFTGTTFLDLTAPFIAKALAVSATQSFIVASSQLPQSNHDYTDENRHAHYDRENEAGRILLDLGQLHINDEELPGCGAVHKTTAIAMLHNAFPSRFVIAKRLISSGCCINDPQRRTPFDLLSTALDSCCTNDDDGNSDDEVMNGEIFDNNKMCQSFHEAAVLFHSCCLKTDPGGADVDLFCWYLASLTCALILSSGHWGVEGWNGTFQRRMETSEAFQSLKEQTSSAFLSLLNMICYDDGYHHLLVSSFLELKLVCVLISKEYSSCGRISKSVAKQVRMMHAYHTTQWACSDDGGCGDQSSALMPIVRVRELFFQTGLVSVESYFSVLAYRLECGSYDIQKWEDIALALLKYNTLRNIGNGGGSCKNCNDSMRCEACRRLNLRVQLGYVSSSTSCKNGGVESWKSNREWWSESFFSFFPSRQKQHEKRSCDINHCRQKLVELLDVNKNNMFQPPSETLIDDLANLNERNNESLSDWIWKPTIDIGYEQDNYKAFVGDNFDEVQSNAYLEDINSDPRTIYDKACHKNPILPLSMNVLMGRTYQYLLREQNCDRENLISSFNLLMSLNDVLKITVFKIIVAAHLFGVLHPFVRNGVWWLARHSLMRASKKSHAKNTSINGDIHKNDKFESVKVEMASKIINYGSSIEVSIALEWLSIVGGLNVLQLFDDVRDRQGRLKQSRYKLDARIKN